MTSYCAFPDRCLTLMVMVIHAGTKSSSTDLPKVTRSHLRTPTDLGLLDRVSCIIPPNRIMRSFLLEMTNSAHQIDMPLLKLRRNGTTLNVVLRPAFGCTSKDNRHTQTSFFLSLPPLFMTVNPEQVL